MDKTTEQRDELLAALQKIMKAAEKSTFKAVSLLAIREIAGPAIKKAQGGSK